MSTTETLREMKLALRGAMNGPVAASMRAKGLTYKVNFGVELPRLRDMSARWPASRELAEALWAEDVRESRLLAAMLMPADDFAEETAMEWVASMRFAEEAECTAAHLLCRLPYASDLGFRLIADAAPMAQICGYLTLARLFMQGRRPTQRDADELLDQAAAALACDSASVRRAALSAVNRFGALGEAEAVRAERLLSAL